MDWVVWGDNKKHIFMEDQVQELLETLPPSSQNNSRKIFLADVARFENNPTDKNRQRLEEWGLSVDHDDRLDHMGDHPDFKS